MHTKLFSLQKEILTHATMWTEDTVLSEVTTKKKEYSYDSIYMTFLKQSNLQKQKVEWWLPEGMEG